MRYEIEMIDVKAADAFLIHYVEENGKIGTVPIFQEDYQWSNRKTEDITLWAMSSYGGQKGPAWIIAMKTNFRALWRHPDDAKVGNVSETSKFLRNYLSIIGQNMSIGHL